MIDCSKILIKIIWNNHYTTRNKNIPIAIKVWYCNHFFSSVMLSNLFSTFAWLNNWLKIYWLFIKEIKIGKINSLFFIQLEMKLNWLCKHCLRMSVAGPMFILHIFNLLKFKFLTSLQSISDVLVNDIIEFFFYFIALYTLYF